MSPEKQLLDLIIRGHLWSSQALLSEVIRKKDGLELFEGFMWDKEMEIVNIDIFNKRRSMGYGEADYEDLKDANGLRLTTERLWRQKWVMS